MICPQGSEVHSPGRVHKVSPAKQQVYYQLQKKQVGKI